MKDYKIWTSVKAKIHNNKSTLNYKEGCIYWVSIGENIGWEQDGKGKSYTRPVLIIKSFGKNLFLGVPLTSQQKNGNYFYKIGEIDGKVSTALILQMRVYDVARISNNGRPIGRLSQENFCYIKEKICALIMGHKPLFPNRVS